MNVDHVRELVQALCRELGYSPNEVHSVHVDAHRATVEVLREPHMVVRDGERVWNLHEETHRLMGVG